MMNASGEAPPFASSIPSPETAIALFVDRLPPSSRLVVAFSGGGDSTGLLALLRDACRARPDLELYAATVDHGLRPGSADEARDAGRVCDTLGVPHAILRWTGTKPATGIQAAARAARYALLAAEAERLGADLVVTGHTADDQRETLAMRRARDPEATSGMDEAVLVERRIWVVRPLLAVGREAIRRYLRARGLAWSEDPSNDNPAFERVRVRQSAGLAAVPPPLPFDRAPVLEAARLARDALRVHAGQMAETTIDRLGFDARAIGMLLGALVAILGGRSHGVGRAAMEAIFARIAIGDDFRFAIGRVVLDRRRDRLFLGREARGLPDITLEAGQRADWDGRFEIANPGPDPVRIGAGRAVTHFPPLVALPANGALPRGISRRLAETTPRVIAGHVATLEVRPMLAPYEHFLTYGRFDLAQALAEAFGSEHFLPLPLGNRAF